MYVHLLEDIMTYTSSYVLSLHVSFDSSDLVAPYYYVCMYMSHNNIMTLSMNKYDSKAFLVQVESHFTFSIANCITVCGQIKGI